MKKLISAFSIVAITVVSLLALTGCNKVPKELRGTYKNGTAGSQWIVTETTAKASPQALLYNFNYKGTTYDVVVIYETNAATLTIDPEVAVTGELVANMTGIKKPTE